MAVTHLRNADRLWEAMSSALLEGRFPDTVTSVITPFGQSDMFRVNICTKDFGNQDEVLRVEDSIISNLNMPVKCLHILTYKAEIYSYLKISNGNKYGHDPRGIRFLQSRYVPLRFKKRGI